MGVKINVPLIMLVLAQVAILVFGIIELKNTSTNWAYYNKHFNYWEDEATPLVDDQRPGAQQASSDSSASNSGESQSFNSNSYSRGEQSSDSYSRGLGSSDSYSRGGQSSDSYSRGLGSSDSYSRGGQSSDSYSRGEQSSDSYSRGGQSSNSYSRGESSSDSYASSEQGASDMIQPQNTITYSRHTQRHGRVRWIELGWKTWCNQFRCGTLLWDAGAVARCAALYGAVTGIVGSAIVILCCLFVAINDNKRLINSKVLIGIVLFFLSFLLVATSGSWMVWVANVNKYINDLDPSYDVSYGYCFVLAILASCMEFFSIALLLLSRWRSAMEIPIGEDAEEEAHYSKLRSQRVTNLL